MFGITELCKEFGITLRALRFYEDKGLLAPRRINGARVYTRRDRARLALILRAKSIGSPLSEIKRYLDLYGDHGEGRAQQLNYVIDRTDTAIHELEQKRAQIDETLAELQLSMPRAANICRTVDKLRANSEKSLFEAMCSWRYCAVAQFSN